jgi:hypothetical protein
MRTATCITVTYVNLRRLTSMSSAFALPGTRPVWMICIRPFIIHEAAAPFGCPVSDFCATTKIGLPGLRPRCSSCL